MTDHQVELEQHALRIKNMLDLFWGRAMPEWAINAVADYSAQLHVAVFGNDPPPPCRPRTPHRSAIILPFKPKPAKGSRHVKQ